MTGRESSASPRPPRLIEVYISGWEQACCGSAFEVGHPITWKLLRADPETEAARDRDAPPLYVEEHHDQTPEGVPHWEVTGTVRAIDGVEYPTVREPGSLRGFTGDRAHPVRSPLRSVAGHNAADPEAAAEYLVTLEVPWGVSLPEYESGAERNAWREERGLEAAREAALLADAIGVRLEALADLLVLRFGPAAEVSRAEDRSAITIVPRDDRSAPLAWARTRDELMVEAGSGRWEFPATTEGVAELEAFALAVAAGRITDEVLRRPIGTEFVTTVRGDDGELWRRSRGARPIVTVRGEDGGCMTLTTDDGPQPRSDYVRYAPWAG